MGEAGAVTGYAGTGGFAFGTTLAVGLAGIDNGTGSACAGRVFVATCFAASIGVVLTMGVNGISTFVAVEARLVGLGRLLREFTSAADWTDAADFWVPAWAPRMAPTADTRVAWSGSAAMLA